MGGRICGRPIAPRSIRIAAACPWRRRAVAAWRPVEPGLTIYIAGNPQRQVAKVVRDAPVRVRVSPSTSIGIDGIDGIDGIGGSLFHARH